MDVVRLAIRTILRMTVAVVVLVVLRVRGRGGGGGGLRGRGGRIFTAGQWVSRKVRANRTQCSIKRSCCGSYVTFEAVASSISGVYRCQSEVITYMSPLAFSVANGKAPL